MQNVSKFHFSVSPNPTWTSLARKRVKAETGTEDAPQPPYRAEVVFLVWDRPHLPWKASRRVVAPPRPCYRYWPPHVQASRLKPFEAFSSERRCVAAHQYPCASSGVGIDCNLISFATRASH